MDRLTDNLEQIADQIRLTLAAKDAAREQALPLCREAIRYCSQAIRAVHAGESVLHPVVARRVIDYFARNTRVKHDSDLELLSPLTEREMDVLRLASKGMTNREIAKELTLSVRTVQVHLSNIFGKLEVGSRTEAVLYALRQGWLVLGDTV